MESGFLSPSEISTSPCISKLKELSGVEDRAPGERGRVCKNVKGATWSVVGKLSGRWPIGFTICGGSWSGGSKRSHVSSNVAKSSSGMVSRSSIPNRASKSNSFRSIFSTIQSVPEKASSLLLSEALTNPSTASHSEEPALALSPENP